MPLRRLWPSDEVLLKEATREHIWIRNMEGGIIEVQQLLCVAVSPLHVGYVMADSEFLELSSGPVSL